MDDDSQDQWNCSYKYPELCRIYWKYVHDVGSGLYRGDFCGGCIWNSNEIGRVLNVPTEKEQAGSDLPRETREMS